MPGFLNVSGNELMHVNCAQLRLAKSSGERTLMFISCLLHMNCTSGFYLRLDVHFDLQRKKFIFEASRCVIKKHDDFASAGSGGQFDW